jgi:hypothetical protein
VLKLSAVKWIDMRNRANSAIQTSKGHSGSQKVSQVESVAFSTKRGTGAQSNSTEAGPTASKQQCHATAFSKSKKGRNRKSNKKQFESPKHDTIAPAVGLKCTDSKYDTIAPAVGPKYSKLPSESVRVVVRSNNLGVLKARIVIQLGDSSLGHNVSTVKPTEAGDISTEKPTVARSSTSEANLLTKSGATNKKKWNKGPYTNSQGPQKSNFRNQRKPFGRKNNKNKGYKSPNSEEGNSIPVRRYTPFTEAQKFNFSRLLKQTLLDC